MATKTIIPEVGMGVTLPSGSDSYPGTIVAISDSGTAITIQQDEVMVTKSNGMEATDYVTVPDPTRPKQIYTLRKNGQWIRKGSPMKSFWNAAYIGHRRYYQDPSF